MNRQLARTINELANTHLKPIVKKAESRDSRYFQTAMFEMQQELGEKAKTIDSQKAECLLLEILRAIKKVNFEKFMDDIAAKWAKERLLLKETDERVSVFMELIEEAENKAPFVSFIVFNRVHFLQFIKNLVEPQHLFKEYRAEKKGEHRARIAMNLIGSVTENLYKHYVKMLWELWKVAEGKKRKINTTAPFGKILQDVVEQLPDKYQILVNKHVAELRNAAQHYGYIYDPKKDSVILLNEDGEAITWIKVPAVYRMAKQMYDISGTYLYHLNFLFMMKYFAERALWEPFSEILKRTDLNKLEDLNALDCPELGQRFEVLLQPVSSYTWERSKRDRTK